MARKKPPKSTDSLYDSLEVSKDASEETIKKAYRKKSMKAHPDRGGSEEEFQQIHNAYLVLSNSTKRKRYDETGDEDGSRADNSQGHLFTMLSDLFMNIMGALIKDLGPASFNYKNIFGLMIAKLKEEIKTTPIRIKALESSKKDLLNIKKRIVKEGQESVFSKRIEIELIEVDNEILKQERAKVMFQQGIEYVSSCEYQVDKEPYKTTNKFEWLYQGLSPQYFGDIK